MKGFDKELIKNIKQEDVDPVRSLSGLFIIILGLVNLFSGSVALFTIGLVLMWVGGYVVMTSWKPEKNKDEVIQIGETEVIVKEKTKNKDEIKP